MLVKISDTWALPTKVLIQKTWSGTQNFAFLGSVPKNSVVGGHEIHLETLFLRSQVTLDNLFIPKTVLRVVFSSQKYCESYGKVKGAQSLKIPLPRKQKNIEPSNPKNNFSCLEMS